MNRQDKETLNRDQREAVLHIGGPSIILAGAGSGKTRVLIHKVVHLITQLKVPADNIVMITFTNKAAGEMKARIKRSLQSADIPSGGRELGFVGTFHSLCAKILRTDGESMGLRRDFVIYTDQDQLDLVKRIIKGAFDARVTPGWILNRISEAKNQLVTPEDFLKVFSYYRAPLVAQVYRDYQESLSRYHAVDFDDLIMQTVRLLRTRQDILGRHHLAFTHLMIDEFQDTNIAQYAFARLLAPPSGNITVVGDFSQAIYSWRGADIRNLERFTDDYPGAKVFYLEQNYRSSQKILDYAYDKIISNQSHPILKLYTKAPAGDGVVEYEAENEEHEALYVGRTILDTVSNDLHQGMGHADRYARYAVLYRTNAQSRILEEVFLKFGIPYTLVGGTRFYDRKEVRDVLAYLRLIMSPHDIVALDRVKKLGKRRLERFTAALPELQIYAEQSTPDTILELTLAKTGYLETLDPKDPDDADRIANIRELKNVASLKQDLVGLFEQIALIENEYSVGERAKNKGEGVRLMSLHASKGLEFDIVFITGLEEGLLPHARSIDDMDALEEERRLFYVGITRARQKLYISWARHRGLYGRRQYSSKSRFVISTSDKEPFDPDPSVSSRTDDWEW